MKQDRTFQARFDATCSLAMTRARLPLIPSSARNFHMTCPSPTYAIFLPYILIHLFHLLSSSLFLSYAELIGTFHNLNMLAYRTTIDTAANMFNNQSFV